MKNPTDKQMTEIRNIVLRETDVSLFAFGNSGQLRVVVRARQLFCYFAKRDVKNVSLSQIAKHVRPSYNHATVLYGNKIIENIINNPKADIELYNLYQKINLVIHNLNNIASIGNNKEFEAWYKTISVDETPIKNLAYSAFIQGTNI